MKIALVLLLCVNLVLLAGCWDQRLLEDLALVFGIAIDADAEKPDTFFMAVTTPAFAEGAEKLTAKTVVEARTLDQGLMNLQLQRERKLEIGKASVIIFDQVAAENGTMMGIIGQLDQQRDANPNAWIVVTQGISAREALYLEPAEQERVAVFLDDLLFIGRTQGQIPQLTLSQFWCRHHSWGISPVAPTVTKTERGGLMLTGLALFDETGKWAGHLSESETVMYMLVADEMMPRGRFYTEVTFQQQHNRLVTVFIKKLDRSVNTRIVDDTPHIDVKLYIELDILNIEMSFDNHLEKEIFTGLETALARDIQGNIMKVISKAQAAGTDPFGFGQFVRAQNLAWVSDQEWNDRFPDSIINVQVRVTLKRIGTLINPTY